MDVAETPLAVLPQRAQPRGVEAWLPVRWEVAGYILLMAVALAMRLWDLGSRAMHHDESLHAVYSWYLYSGRGYHHDPMMHGPFQFHMNTLVFFLFGDTDFTARLGYALFGTALVGLPWFLRRHLGRAGALATAFLLAFSPTLLYFSRFARNDILMAVWTLGLVIAIWRYLDERRATYLYILAALLALAFATKETAYLAVVVLGAFLFFLALEDIKGFLMGRRRLSQFGPAGTLLIVIGSLALPLFAPLVSLAQGKLGIVLANPDFTKGAIGLPQGAGWYVAVAMMAAMLLLSVVVGLLWNWRRWLVLATVFYGIWVVLYTTEFTNPFGVVSGMWQSMGYWIAQQEVRRGGQPWYYYFVIGWNYEFLPLLLGIVAGVYYALRGSLFARFLVFWAVVNFALYTWAGEKMPWLLVHVTLPFILLGGKALGALIEAVPWTVAWRRSALLGAALVPLLMIVFFRVVFLSPHKSLAGFLSLWGWLLVIAALVIAIVLFVRRVGWRGGWALVSLGGVAMLVLLTVRAGWIATYRNGDVPKEMLVYTQSSPDIPRIARQVRELAQASADREAINIVVDGDDGFAWPWVWYLRDFTAVGYPGLAAVSPGQFANTKVVLANAGNLGAVRDVLGQGFVEGGLYYHRWWFPETYRDVTPSKFWRGLRDRGVWRKAMDYWLYRKLGTPLGHVDAYAFYATDLARLSRPGP
ncbi:MAG: TIGR03663 family protein [Chloroflexi bacterium]|nr:TIGR03663 family protein [Chloroflexota bacterium]